MYKKQTSEIYKSLKQKKENNMPLGIKNNKGITIVALVITIIVLVILAGVVIKLSIGDNGVISRAKDSATKYDEAQNGEIGIFNDISDEYDQIIGGNWSIGGSGNNTGGGTNPDTNTVDPGGDTPTPPNPDGSGNLTQEEKDKLTDNGIGPMNPEDITNDNLKDNENIKVVITGEVPIPTGGEYKEGTKETGVVVAMGESEFVWVPVPNIAEMAVLQEGSTENYQGVLYDFSGTTATPKNIVAIGSTTGYREPVVLSSRDTSTNLNIINNILGTSYASNTESARSQFKVDMQNDFNKMVASVKKYKGFYVGRYEVSIDLATKRAYSKVGVLPATAAKDSANTWYGLYAYQKKMAETNGYTSVESHMIWGSTYDAMLRWALTGADAGKVSSIGNAAHDLSTVYETGKETIASKPDRINNIYDLEGNGMEWTAEAYNAYARSIRGGRYNIGYLPSNRYEVRIGYSDYVSLPDYTLDYESSRPILYIK